MRFSFTRKALLTLGTVGFVMTGSAVVAQALTLTGSELDGLTYVTNGSNTATVSGGVISLTSVGDSGFYGDATVIIPNGYLGVALPATLGAFVATPGGASFDLTAGGTGGQYAYWNVELTNGTNTISLNAFGINSTGANNFSATGGGTAYSLNGGAGVNLFANWASIDGTVVDGLALGSWDLAAVSISAGGWGCCSQTDTIDSITLPGTYTPAATPLPASIWMFGAVLAGGLGVARYRRRKKSAAVMVVGPA